MIRKTTILLTALMGSCSVAASGSKEALHEALTSQPEEMQARYEYRNPGKTLMFFGIEPGMTVMEGLPGGGWYSKILLPYLGSEGTLIGADYAQDMWGLFGFFDQDFIDNKATWPADFVEDAQEWRGEAGAEVAAFQFGNLPEDMKGTADVVIMVRALHNLSRFEGKGAFLTKGLADIHAILKPGGILGVVQHEVGDARSDEWADGSKGYLKKSRLIEQIEAAGFELDAEAAFNNNPKDQPGEEDVVWRLPPTLMGSRDNPERRAEMEAIGESNRMTLKFVRK